MNLAGTDVILGLDPAYGMRKHPGVAVVSNERLIAAAAVVIPSSIARDHDLGSRVHKIADFVVAWFRHFVPYPHPFFGGSDKPKSLTLVWEWPQVYGVGKSRVDPNDLPPLAALGNAVARDMRPDVIVTPKPREWQAGTSKNVDGPAWDCTRGAKLRTRLMPEELALIPESHDAIDAVCLALHPTSRALAVQRRVYPGASPRRG